MPRGITIIASNITNPLPAFSFASMSGIPFACIFGSLSLPIFRLCNECCNPGEKKMKERKRNIAKQRSTERNTSTIESQVSTASEASAVLHLLSIPRIATRTLNPDLAYPEIIPIPRLSSADGKTCIF
jgi:hypothetical protein